MPTYGTATALLPETYSTNTGQNDASVINTTSKYPVYRIFFKGSNVPVDIMTESVWGLCRHKGFRAGLGSEKGYYQKAGHMTSLHFAGNRHPWNSLIVPNNDTFGSIVFNQNQAGHSVSSITNSSAELQQNYMPIDNVAAVFHRNIVAGLGHDYESNEGTKMPTVKNSNVFRVALKGGSGASIDIKAGGWAVTRQPTVRMIKPDGNFDNVERIVQPNKPLVYFYSYGGQYYSGDDVNSTELGGGGGYPANTTSYEYILRSGLAGTRIGHYNSSLIVNGVEGNYNVVPEDDDIYGTPLSLDTGATYLPIENVESITQLNSGDSSITPTNTTWSSNTNNLKPFHTIIRDDNNNSQPLVEASNYTDVYQPAPEGESMVMNNY